MSCPLVKKLRAEYQVLAQGEGVGPGQATRPQFGWRSFLKSKESIGEAPAKWRWTNRQAGGLYVPMLLWIALIVSVLSICSSTGNSKIYPMLYCIAYKKDAFLKQNLSVESVTGLNQPYCSLGQLIRKYHCLY